MEYRLSSVKAISESVATFPTWELLLFLNKYLFDIGVNLVLMNLQNRLLLIFFFYSDDALVQARRPRTYCYHVSLF